jgi:hypothetical protein
MPHKPCDRVAQQPTPALADQARLAELTPREREVLDLVARGLPNRSPLLHRDETHVCPDPLASAMAPQPRYGAAVESAQQAS